MGTACRCATSRGAALITHAGHGTIMQAIASAVPMVCPPTGRDQLVNARRVQDCHLGIALEP
jgi:UDP:flavonoid glycosyltransferase YjiC (YdhE family)